MVRMIMKILKMKIIMKNVIMKITLNNQKTQIQMKLRLKMQLMRGMMDNQMRS